MSVYTIHSYFNSQQIQGVLNAVVMLVGSGGVDGDYLSLVRVAGMLGMFMAVTYGFLRARGEDAAYYMIMVAIFYSTLFVPRVTVLIEDHGGAGAGSPIPVDNVPIGLAFFASTTSHIGYWLTERTETFFSLPDTSLTLSQHGLMGGSRALRLAQSAAIPDPVLAQDMINFMRDCINPELVTSPILVKQLLSSKNIWHDMGPAGIGVLNPGRMVTLSGSGAVTCDIAYKDELGPMLAPAATSEFARIAQMMSPNSSPATAQTLLQALLPASEGLIMTASASTTESIRQRMMINVLNNTSASMAQIMNDPSAAQTALGSAMATSNANTAYSVMARLSQETLPLVRNSMELVIIGVFPIVLILIIIAGSKGGLVLRSYVMTMLWVQLWAPLYAIVNYVGMMAGAKSMKASLASVDGIAINNAAQLLNTTISGEAIAGMLTIAVPMIALSIIKGGEVAMSGVTSTLLGPSQQSASSAGGQVGSGNVAMGNTSWGNYNANTSLSNKSDNALGHVDPNFAKMTTPFGSYDIRGAAAETKNKIGNGIVAMGNAGVTGSHGEDVRQGQIQASGVTAQYTKGSETGLTTGTKAQYSKASRVQAQAEVGNIASKIFGNDTASSNRVAAGNSRSSLDQVNTTASSGHNESLGINSEVAAMGNASTTATNTIKNAQNRNANEEAHDYLYPRSGQAGAAGGQAVGGAAGGQAVGGAAGGQAVGGAAGGQAEPSGAKAARLANVLDKVPILNSAVGIAAKLGLAIKTGETQAWSTDKGQSASQAQRAEQNFEQLTRAVDSHMANETDAGKRSAMSEYMGSIAKATDSLYGTKTSENWNKHASLDNSRQDSAGANVSVNDNPSYFATAMAMSGGNAARALENLASVDTGFRNAVKNATAPDIANQTVPRDGNATGMDGTTIAPPVSTERVQAEGKKAVGNDRQTNEAAARSAGSAAMQQAEQDGVLIGAPSSTHKPDTTKLRAETTRFEQGTAGAIDQQTQATDRDRGLTIMAAAEFDDKKGMGRLVGVFGDQTHDEIRAQLKELRDKDPLVASRMDLIGKKGVAEEGDREFIASRAKR